LLPFARRDGCLGNRVGRFTAWRKSIVIEWPEHIQAALPADRLWIALVFVDENKRQLTLTATSARYQRLLDILRDFLPE